MSDFAARIEEARRSRLPLKRLIEQHGKGPANGNWQRFPACPFCGSKDSAGVFAKDSYDLFKCHKAPGRTAGCPTGNKVLDEIGFLAQETGASRRDAAVQYLKEAGLWTEERLPPSVMPGQRARKKRAPEVELPPDPSLPDQPVGSDPEAGESFESASVPDPTPPAAASGTEKSREPADVDVRAVWIPPARQIGWPKASGEPLSDMDLYLQDLCGNGGDRKPPPPPAPKIDGDVPLPLRALREFYSVLTLSEEDKKKLWDIRGLLPETCERFGLRSNPKSNRDLLMNLTVKYPLPALVEAGLFVQDKGGQPQPNNRYWGYGRIRKKPKEQRQHEEDKWVYGWNHPILIPSFDSEGQVVALRPHKDHLAGAVMRLYVARPRGEKPNPRLSLAVITEGEFKGMALWQVLGDRAAIACLPGITMARQLLPDIEEWLEEIQPLARVVVAYDSEEKADEKLPGYIPEKWRRFDAVIWSRFLARHLARASFDARVAMLPKEWRDEKGKADWDGALAQRIKDTMKMARRGNRPEEIWREVALVIVAAFEAVLHGASRVEVAYQSGFFDSEEERIIRNGLERLLYDPKLPAGGDTEVAHSRRLRRLAKKMRDDARLNKMQRGFLFSLGKAYDDLKGGYYQFKNLSDRMQAEWRGLMAKANDDEDLELKRICELVLKGIPQRVSNFTMDCHYVLRKMGGTRQRLVTLRNIHGEFTRTMAPLGSAHFAQPSKFREWLLDVGGYVWRAGERELNDLQADLVHQAVNKDVEEVPLRGWYEPVKMWFFEDVAFDAEGKELYPDKHGIFWVRRDNLTQGYRLGDRDIEGETFRQGSPRLQAKEKADPKWKPAAFANEVCTRMYDTLGGFEGFIALGMTWACLAAPEIYGKWNAMPGLWIHGEQSQGKSSVARWLIRFFGFSPKQASGIPLPNSSAPGVAIGAQQYGFLPLWLEEYQPDKIRPEVIEMLKEMFGHETGSKKRFGELEREKRAVPLVTGVATSHDGQVKSRYAHVQVSEKKRIGNHFDWFQAESEQFYRVGRMLLQRRKEYVGFVLESLATWMEGKALAGIDVRARLVHGVAYAGFIGMLRLFPDFEWQVDTVGYQKFLVEYCGRALSDVQEQVNVNQFWVDLLNAITVGAFGESSSDLRRYFRWKEEEVAAPLKHPDQVGKVKWRRAFLYFKYSAVIGVLEQYKRARNQVFPFNASDLRAQLRVKPYWVEAKTKHESDHRQRFEAQTPHRCWCICVELHEMGYREVSDADLEASMYRDGRPENGIFVSSLDYQDPRYGELYALGDRLKKAEESVPDGR